MEDRHGGDGRWPRRRAITAPLPAQRPRDHRVVDLDEDAADRMPLLRADPSLQHVPGGAREPRRPEVEMPHAGEHQAQRRVQRDRQHRGDEHGEGLRVGERLEEPPFLGLERQDGEERARR